MSDTFGQTRRRIAYERMLLDVLKNNSALFVRRDEVEAMAMDRRHHRSLAQHGAAGETLHGGKLEPSAAIALAERNGHSWHE